MELLKDELIHLSFSLLSAFILFWLFGSLWFFPFCLALGFFIDIDHWFDYLYCFFNLPDKKMVKKNLFSLSFHLKNFFNPSYYVLRNNMVFVPLHGWEYLPFFWLALRMLGKGIGVIGLEWSVLAYFFHLAWDQYTSSGNPLAYFFSHRLKNNFSYEAYKNPLKK